MSLVDRYAGLVVDLDGVVVREEEVIPAAARFLTDVRSTDLRVAFVTNNATRTAERWVEVLASGGVRAEAAQIVSSAVAAAQVVTENDAAACYVIGERGLVVALEAAGARVVDDPAEADAVVVGSDRRLSYPKLRDATRALVRGARFVATNPDVIRPGVEGPLPGTGATLAYLESATGVAPEVVGKPALHLLRLAADRLSVDGPVLVVGDQVATDVLAASRMGWDAALVLTGVSTWASLIGAPTQPTWVLRDLARLAGDEPATVRAARREDAAAVRSLLETAEDEVLVAETPPGGVVGAVSWDPAGWIRDLGVAPGRDGDTAIHLVARAAEELRRRGASEVSALAGDNRKVFESLGFRDAGSDHHAAGGDLLVLRLIGDPQRRGG